MSGHTALYVMADDYWKGRKYIQYVIRKDDDEIILFTANSYGKDFEEMKDEFEKIMSSVKIE